ncbi:rCG44790, partial [Rattus norvegicus]
MAVECHMPHLPSVRGT